jgi:hypothetical protein
MSSRRDMVERSKTKRQREAEASRQGRFGRGSAGQAQATRRFARSTGQTEPVRRFGRANARAGGGMPGRRHRQPDQSGAQKLMQAIQGVLPGRGKSSAKRGKRSGGSIPAVGGFLSSRGGRKGRGAGRGRKPAVFGLLGAGAAGAAAAVAKRRHSSRSPQLQVAEGTGVSQAQATSTETPPRPHPADTPEPSETAHDLDARAGDEPSQRPDTPAAEDQRG